MPSHRVSPTNVSSPRRSRNEADRPLRVLVVDPSTAAGRLLQACAPEETSLHVTRVGTLAAARQHMASKPVDLAVIEADLPDGSGLSLHEALHRRYRRMETLIVTATPTLDTAVQALRTGAVDFLTKPLDPAVLTDRLRQVIAKQAREREQAQRVRRLRRVCRKLDHARQEVTEQVDVLCEDLVGAYQELAGQMQEAVSRREFEVAIEDELDLEPLLRKTLMFLVDKAGPTNAAVFLPAMTPDEFSLGGYVNYDCATGSADMLLQHLGDVVAPNVASHTEPLHLRTDESLAEWIGDDAVYLAECEVVAFGCEQEGEALAALVLFRDRDQPFDETALQACRVVSELLGERLVKLIRIHHRMAADHSYPSDDLD